MEGLNMLAELRTKSQITIPKKLITKLGIKEGDKLEITEKNGIIQIVPVVVYPKKYVDELRLEVAEAKTQLKIGNKKTFKNIEKLFTELDN